MKVRIIAGPPDNNGVYALTEHPTEHRMLKIGDIIELSKIDMNGYGHFGTYLGVTKAIKPDWFELVEPKPRIHIQTKTVFIITRHPTERRPIRDGDIFEVDCIDKEGDAFWVAYSLENTWTEKKHFVLLTDKEQMVAATPPSCSCDMVALMREGCKCGALQAEREASA